MEQLPRRHHHARVERVRQRRAGDRDAPVGPAGALESDHPAGSKTIREGWIGPGRGSLELVLAIQRVPDPDARRRLLERNQVPVAIPDGSDDPPLDSKARPVPEIEKAGQGPSGTSRAV